MDVNYETLIDEVDDNVDGEGLKVDILKFSDGLEVRIRTRWKNSFQKRCWLLVIILAASVLSSIYELIDDYCSIVILVFVLVLIASIFRLVKQERLLVVKSLGYQIETTYVFNETTDFVPWDSIQDVFINEVITLQRVLYILTIYAKEKKKLIPLFTMTRPRLMCLHTIYRTLKTL